MEQAQVDVWLASLEDRSRARALLRDLLAAYAGKRPDELVIVRRRGKPSLAGTPLEFSLSYGRGTVAYAVAGQPVGIDIEAFPTTVEWTYAARVLPPGARARIAALPPRRRERAFLEAWTTREALAKAAGLELGSGELERALRLRQAWTTRVLRPRAGHVIAVALRGPAMTVRVQGTSR